MVENANLQEIIHKIKQQYPSMTRSLQVFADFVIAEPVTVARTSIHSAVQAAGVSTATANRFVRVVGYKNYATFRDNIIRSIASAYEPVNRMRSEMAKLETPDRIAASILQQDIENLQETISQIDPHAWATAVQMITQAPRIFVVSFDNGASLAQILANGLLRIKTDVHCISNGGGGFGGVRHIVNMAAPDLVIAIAFPRYIKDTIRLATLAKDKGVPVLGITDTHRSPLATVCNTNLYVSVRRQFASVSNAAVLSLIEALLGSVLHSTPEAVERAQVFTEDALPWMENP